MTTTPHLPMKASKRNRASPPEAKLVFSPLAWLKLQYLCHAGDTEVAAFGLSHPADPLYLDDVLVVKQRASAASVAFDDGAVADLFDRMLDGGVPPARFARVWLHTTPGPPSTRAAPTRRPSPASSGACDWAVMAILGRTGRVSARLAFPAGPGGAVELASAVDWAAWPRDAERLEAERASWERDYALVEVEPHFEFRKLNDDTLTGVPHDYFGR